MANVIRITNYNCTVITNVNFDPKTFIVQATDNTETLINDFFSFLLHSIFNKHSKHT